MTRLVFDKSFNNIIGIFTCLLAIVFAGWIFWGELWLPIAHMSDVTFHLSILHALDHTIKNGGNPVDFWYDGSPFGFALFRGYQHLPHLIIYFIYRISGEYFPLETVLRTSTCILAMLMPLTFYAGARLLCFSRLSAGFTALFSVLVVEIGNYGLGLHNYNWGSGGIISQLWATCFLLPAIGCAVRYIREGKYLGISVFLGFCTFGSHVVAIFVLGVAVVLFVGCQFAVSLKHSSQEAAKTFKRTLAYFGSLAVVTTHQWFYTLLDAPYLRGSIHEPRWKFESHGIRWALENFSKGNIFDFGHFPTITLMILIGLVFCIINPARLLKNNENGSPVHICRWLVLSLLVSLSLLCGWELWGWSVNLVGILRSLHWHRLIIAVQLFGLLLAGLGASIIFTSIRYRSLAILVIVALMYPAVLDRVNFFSLAKTWPLEAVSDQKKDSDLILLLDELGKLPRGRIYTGMSRDWSSEYKIGSHLYLHHIVTGSGLPTYGMLYYPMSLAGDVMFDVALERRAQRQLLGLRYFVIPPDRAVPEGLIALAQYGRYRIFQDPALTMLDVVDIKSHLTGDLNHLPEAMRKWFSSALVEEKSFEEVPTPDNSISIGEAIDSNAMPVVPATTISFAGKVISESAWQVDSIEGYVALERSAFVLFKVPYHPNWNATVDNKRVDPVWVTPGFMAIPSEAGTHKVSFHYQGSRIKFLLFLLGFLGPWGGQYLKF